MKRPIRVLAVAATTVLGLALPGLSQTPTDLAAMGAEMRRNQEMLWTYSWQSKVTFEVDGVQRRTDVYKVAYDANGSLQRTQISGEVAKDKVRGTDGKKLSKKELETARAFVMDAKNQLDAYLSPVFAEKAVSTSTATVDGELLKLHARDVVNTGDSVEIVLSNATRLPQTLHATATVDGNPLGLEVTFGVLPYGPYYPKTSATTTSWQGIPLKITTENSDYSQ